MMSNTVRFLACVTLWLLCCGVGRADVLTLVDGSRLVGKLDELRDGTLVITTDFAGKLEIDAAKVRSIATEKPVVVGLSTGDRLVGPIEWDREAENPVVHTGMGGIAISFDKIEAIWQTDGKSPEVVAMEVQMADERKIAEGKLGKWSATIEMGGRMREGNTETLNARARIELQHKSDLELLKFYLAGEYGEQNDQRDTAEAKLGAYYEHMIGRRFFGYTKSEAEYDEFENLDLRFTVSAGVGYYWIKQDHHELKTHAGPGYMHEAFMDDVTKDSVMLDIGLNYRLDLNNWLQFVHSTSYYPTCESVRDYRLVSDSALLIPLGNSDRWKIKLGALFEYDALPPAGVDRLDRTYYGNLVFNLK